MDNALLARLLIKLRARGALRLKQLSQCLLVVSQLAQDLVQRRKSRKFPSRS